ncbi:hypothetical protein Y032_0019g3740 [Ancylostoma ceylanicum]|uniref:Reverse transcriptase domain-containing protein n=1 Tax=Ancylostoma ceylanicum TaxID=53326 RepID=A0A016V3I7_9BILA|nr:hypothetical protein Y032_0019g3740 [Ancylostoma ceylanicum]
MRASRVSERIQYDRPHIHTVSRLTEVSREYKMPLCLTFIDLKKAFDTVETEAVLEALGTQGVPTQYIRIFRELYCIFTTRISPFYDDTKATLCRRNYSPPPSRTSCEDWNGTIWERELTAGCYTIFASLMRSSL